MRHLRVVRRQEHDARLSAWLAANPDQSALYEAANVALEAALEQALRIEIRGAAAAVSLDETTPGLFEAMRALDAVLDRFREEEAGR